MLLLFRNRASGGASFPDGMVARWTLDDQTAGYVDLVGGLTLTAQGAGTTIAPGVINDAALFNRSGWLTTPNNAAFQQQTGFAIEAWCLLDLTISFTKIVVGKCADLGIANGDYFLCYRTSGVWAYFWQETARRVVESTSLATETWTHLVAAYTAAAVNLYVNGVLEGTAARVTALTASSEAFSLAAPNNGANPLPGRIDEVAIWQFGVSGDPGAAFWLARYNGGAGVRP